MHLTLSFDFTLRIFFTYKISFKNILMLSIDLVFPPKRNQELEYFSSAKLRTTAEKSANVPLGTSERPYVTNSQTYFESQGKSLSSVLISCLGWPKI